MNSREKFSKKEYLRPNLNLLSLEANVLTASGVDATSPFNMDWYMDLEV